MALPVIAGLAGKEIGAMLLKLLAGFALWDVLGKASGRAFGTPELWAQKEAGKLAVSEAEAGRKTARETAEGIVARESGEGAKAKREAGAMNLQQMLAQFAERESGRIAQRGAVTGEVAAAQSGLPGAVAYPDVSQLDPNSPLSLDRILGLTL